MRVIEHRDTDKQDFDRVQKTATSDQIHGAAGSVDSFATQITKLWGAQVIGTASGDDVVYLRALGYVQVVDYKQERFETVGQVDAVLDLIGGETAARSFAVVKKDGVMMVSTVGAANAELALTGLSWAQHGWLLFSASA